MLTEGILSRVERPGRTYPGLLLIRGEDQGVKVALEEEVLEVSPESLPAGTEPGCELPDGREVQVSGFRYRENKGRSTPEE
jgi:hypothetical protein